VTTTERKKFRYRRGSSDEEEDSEDEEAREKIISEMTEESDEDMNGINGDGGENGERASKTSQLQKLMDLCERKVAMMTQFLARNGLEYEVWNHCLFCLFVVFFSFQGCLLYFFYVVLFLLSFSFR
jgi:hypothetical protein